MPVSAVDFRLFSVRAVAFTPSQGDGFKTSRVLASVVPKFPRYDGETQSLPGPKALGPMTLQSGEIAEVQLSIASGPFVELNSEDRRWKFRATPDRTDSFRIVLPNEEFGSDSLQAICRECVEPLLHFPGTDNQTGRLALIVRRIAPIHDAPSELAIHFCKPEMVDPQRPQSPLRNSVGFHLDNLKKYTSPPLARTVNSWMKCHSGRVADRPTIHIEQDTNTLIEEAAATSFSETDIRTFFDWAASEINDTLRKYFP